MSSGTWALTFLLLSIGIHWSHLWHKPSVIIVLPSLEDFSHALSRVLSGGLNGKPVTFDKPSISTARLVTPENR